MRGGVKALKLSSGGLPAKRVVVMDPRESLHVADLVNTNFSTAMSNVDSYFKNNSVLRTSLGPVKARYYFIGIGALIFPKGDGSN